MKTQVKLSPLFLAYAIIRKIDADKLVQACESVQNARDVSGVESSGTKNERKSKLAKSSETVSYATASNVVTAFIQYAEAEVGSLDKTVAKLAKLGVVGGELADVPATLHGFNVNDWLAKFPIGLTAEEQAKADADAKAKEESDAKAKADAKEAIKATKKQVADAKKAKTPVVA